MNEELLKTIFGADEQLDMKSFGERLDKSGVKLADISKGDYVAKKKYDDEIASLTAKNTTLEAEKAKLVEVQNAGKTQEQKNLEDLKSQLDAIRATSDASAKELDMYKKKEVMRANGIESQRFMDLALFELKDSKDFDADVKTWAESNKDLIAGKQAEPKGKTIPPLAGNPNNNDNPESDPFMKGLLSGTGLTAKDLK